MDEQHRLAGFRALIESHKTNSYHLEEPNGSFRLWSELSSEGRLAYVIRDAAYYNIPFEQFAEVARSSLGNGAIEAAALRLAFQSGRELHDLESLFPGDGRLESPPPLVDRVTELLNASSSGHEDEVRLTPKEQRALFEEWRADEAAAKRTDAHWYGKVTPPTSPDIKTKPSRGKEKDIGIER